jgi:16S rRNA (guanine966-N2)-methyltransferase
VPRLRTTNISHAAGAARQTGARSDSAVRIIAGTLRGSKLAVAQHASLRPTPDRVRETLFNWLAPYLPQAIVLDAFAGTGVLGLEALSRGAAHAIFVEREPQLADALRAALMRLRVIARASVHVGALQQLVALLAAPYKGQVRIAFLDPPFAQDLHLHALSLLLPLLSDDALVYVEAPKDAMPIAPAPWTSVKSSYAGTVGFALWQRQVSAA